MGYKIDIDALDTLFESVMQQSNDWNAQISDVYSELSTIVNTTNMSGATANNLKNYFSCVHFSILSSLLGIIDLHLKNCLLYKTDYQTNIDTNLHAIIHSEELKYFKEKLQTINNFAVELDGEVVSALSSVSDIFSVSYTNVTSVCSAHNTVINQITTLDSDIIALEDYHKQNDFINTTSSISSLTAFISEQMSNARGYKSDFSIEGFVANSVNFAEVYSNFESLSNESTRIEADVAEAEKVHVDRVQKLMEEEFEERAENAKVINWVVAGICVVGSAALIVATAGAATPVVAAVSIGTSAVSSATIAGTANLTSQYVEHGNIVENADKIDWQSFGKDVGINFVSGAATGALGFGIGKGVEALGKTAWVTSKMSTVTNGYAKIAIHTGTGAVKEVGSGIVTRFTGEAIVSGGDWEASLDKAIDGKQILLDATIGGTAGGVEEFTRINKAQKAADDYIKDFNDRYDMLDNMQQKGYTNLKEGKNSCIDFSESDYILKTDEGEVIEIKIKPTGSAKGDYELAEKIVSEKYNLELKSMRTGKNRTHSWYYLDNYDALNDEITLQFVEKKAVKDVGPRATGQTQYHMVHGIECYQKDAINVKYEGIDIGDYISDNVESLNDVYENVEKIDGMQYAY